MKLTLREAIAASKALQVMPKLPAKAAYDLARWRNKLQPEIDAYVEQERALVKDHGGTIKDNGGITWPHTKKGEPSPEAACTKARDELLDHEIDIDRQPVKLDAILGSDPAKQPEIAPELLAMLEKIIVE